jgi:NAD(P)-dependent dehydrogenase (short-subunit alcohol dehydrogenase family)
MADGVVEEIRRAGGEAVGSYESVVTMEGGAAIVQSAVDAFGRVDIVVNNAGILRDKTLLKMEESMWDAVMAVHLKGMFAVTQAGARRMVEQGEGGRIINTSSMSGLIGNFGQSNYGAAKAGTVGFTRVAALELQRYAITVNAIVPVAKTRMTEDIAATPKEFVPELISPMVVFLASELAKDVTGRVFGVQGPQLCEYKYVITPGVARSEGLWTPEEIAERFDDITR